MAKTYVDIDKDHAHIRKICRKLDADLKTVNKTAVNIPFGTGKTVVLEQIVYDNMDKNILVFVPTHLVRNKHLDSINQYCRKVYKNGRVVTPKNVTIRCYNSIKKCFDEPWDIIFADEYHHLGGEVWSKQFDALLKDNPNAKVIGTTATHIRSDGKDMTEILFGHTSSEITTTSAINSGILPHAKFYGAVYSLDGVYSKVQTVISKISIGENEKINKKLLGKLKKQTENANRLREFFDEAIPAKGGKYVVFCSNIDQMNMVWNKIDEWFAGKKISKYFVYYKNSKRANEKAIREFEAEDSSDRLVFMLNINIIGEGYHFKDLDGVIIYRPTKSIVRYPQQTGRPMTMNWKIYGNIPTIIELTNSIEDLKIFYTQPGIYRDRDMILQNIKSKYLDKEIDFSIYKDDIEILDILKTLEYFETHKTFKIGFIHAKQYYEEHGNLLVSQRYVCDDGFKLGVWVFSRRREYKKLILTEDIIELLESVGMIWNFLGFRFENGFIHAEKYYKEHGNLLVSQKYVCDDGFKLGNWVFSRIYEYKNGLLSKEKIELLESIGIIWDFLGSKFEYGFIHAERYFKEHGNLLVNVNYVCDDGFELGRWISRKRIKYNEGKLPYDKIKRLESIGMVWNVSENVIEKRYSHAKQYFEEHGNLLVPQRYICDDEYPLGRKISIMRKRYKEGKLTIQEIHAYEAIGMVWDGVIDEKFMIKFIHAEKYYKEHGNLLVSQRYVCDDGFKLGVWISWLRRKYNKGELSEEKIKLLESIGMVWDDVIDEKFMMKFIHAKQYYEEHGNLLVLQKYVCDDGFKLGVWISWLRRKYNKGELSEEKIKLLESIGMVWNHPKGNTKYKS